MLLGCTNFTGGVPRDAVAEAAETPDVVVDAADDVPVPDAAPVDGGRSCGPRGACDPVRGSGCAEGLACGLASDGSPRCAARGETAVFGACDDTAGCAAGLSCVERRCVRLCCDDDACADLSTSRAQSRCAVKTVVPGFYGCTRPGSCDYRLQTGCAARQQCLPSSLHGGGSCLADGTAREGEPCTFSNSCAWPNSCVGSPGTCRPTCSSLLGGCAGGGQCLRFSDRPADFGFCE